MAGEGECRSGIPLSSGACSIQDQLFCQASGLRAGEAGCHVGQATMSSRQLGWPGLSPEGLRSLVAGSLAPPCLCRASPASRPQHALTESQSACRPPASRSATCCRPESPLTHCQPSVSSLPDRHLARVSLPFTAFWPKQRSCRAVSTPCSFASELPHERCQVSRWPAGLSQATAGANAAAGRRHGLSGRAAGGLCGRCILHSVPAAHALAGRSRLHEQRLARSCGSPAQLTVAGKHLCRCWCSTGCAPG